MAAFFYERGTPVASRSCAYNAFAHTLRDDVMAILVSIWNTRNFFSCRSPEREIPGRGLQTSSHPCMYHTRPSSGALLITNRPPHLGGEFRAPLPPPWEGNAELGVNPLQGYLAHKKTPTPLLGPT